MNFKIMIQDHSYDPKHSATKIILFVMRLYSALSRFRLENLTIIFIASYLILYTSYFSCTEAQAVPYHTIIVDGDLSDWSGDEVVSADTNDSSFDPGTGKNEIQNLYVTWDKENLYIGIEGQTNGNGLLLYVDADPGSNRGVGNLTKINNWNRRIIFSGSVPLAGGATVPFLSDFFFGSWDGSGGNFYSFSSSNNVTDISGQTSQSTSRGSRKPGAEIKVPFNTLYALGTGIVPGSAKVALVSAIGAGDVGGDVVNGVSIGFGFLSGDSAPSNVNGVSLTNFTTSTLNNFAVVSLDTNADGIPDNSFLNISRLTMTKPVMNPNPFAPGTAGSARSTSISFSLTLPSLVQIKIFDLSGKLVRYLANETVSFSVSPQKVEYVWDGKNDASEVVPMGIYIVNVRAGSSAGGVRENAAVAVIK